jgi:hypothetical protein
MIEGGGGRGDLGRREEEQKEIRGPYQVLERTGERFRGSGNRIKIGSMADEELGITTGGSQTPVNERLPGPNGNDFSREGDIEPV